MILCVLNMASITFTPATFSGRVHHHRLVVGLDHLAAVAPEQVHHVVGGVLDEPEAHAEGEQPGRRLDLLAGLDELVPRLRVLDLGLPRGGRCRACTGQGFTASGTPMARPLKTTEVIADSKMPLGSRRILVDEIVDVEQVAAGRVELHVGRTRTGA